MFLLLVIFIFSPCCCCCCFDTLFTYLLVVVDFTLFLLSSLLLFLFFHCVVALFFCIPFYVISKKKNSCLQYFQFHRRDKQTLRTLQPNQLNHPAKLFAYSSQQIYEFHFRQHIYQLRLQIHSLPSVDMLTCVCVCVYIPIGYRYVLSLLLLPLLCLVLLLYQLFCLSLFCACSSGDIRAKLVSWMPLAFYTCTYIHPLIHNHPLGRLSGVAGARLSQHPFTYFLLLLVLFSFCRAFTQLSKVG